jgi:hypothetical protein
VWGMYSGEQEDEGEGEIRKLEVKERGEAHTNGQKCAAAVFQAFLAVVRHGAGGEEKN